MDCGNNCTLRMQNRECTLMPRTDYKGGHHMIHTLRMQNRECTLMPLRDYKGGHHMIHKY